jgi:hypothetical protein
VYSVTPGSLLEVISEYSVLPWSGGSIQDCYDRFTGVEEVSPVVRLKPGEVLTVISTQTVRMNDGNRNTYFLILSPTLGPAILYSYAFVRGAVRVIP